MEAFIDTITVADLRDPLAQAIRGRGRSVDSKMDSRKTALKRRAGISSVGVHTKGYAIA